MRRGAARLQLALTLKALGPALEPYLADTLQGRDVGDNREEKHDAVEDIPADQEPDHGHDDTFWPLEQACLANEPETLGARTNVADEERTRQGRERGQDKPLLQRRVDDVVVAPVFGAGLQP